MLELMGWPRHNRLIALGSLLLLAGVLLIIRAADLLPNNRPAPAPRQSIDHSQPMRPPATAANTPWRGRARKIAQDLIAPPQLDPAQIQRVEPRPPLSDLGLAAPAGMRMPKDWKEVLLYQPVATSSATFESMGRKIAISGIQGIDLDETCSFRGVAWPCGQRARAAFNSWLRGRALKCVVPPEIDRFAIAAPCSLGKQDVGAWLVSNGWATALASGIYGKAEAVARDAEMGIFGPPQ
ncbi:MULTISPECIES: thermonuclease family protein [unclassified Mesorhizobium]|uniref:thermonuclease family protein n=1 Tax=unclassified Mesorhizobium TaxID=325217 RepID=UPI001FD9C2A5|nr:MULTISPECIES: thermonuclease family protein [unclassified Mesorhizobium]WJI77892.1 thermonuclease family protein [Mesorhizobium sp. C395A]